jgi:hypothetical protein
MTALRQAVHLGFKGVKELNEDHDLDPLRDREDFKNLLAELEAKYPQPPAKSDGKPEDERMQRLRLAVSLLAGWPAVR